MGEKNQIANFVKFQRNEAGLTQGELAEKAGVGLRFVRDLEQGKDSLRMDKVNQVLAFFGYKLTPSDERLKDPFEIHRWHMNQHVEVHLKNKNTMTGFIIDDVKQNNQTIGWKFISNNKAIEYNKTKNPELITIINHLDIEDIYNLES